MQAGRNAATWQESISRRVNMSNFLLLCFLLILLVFLLYVTRVCLLGCAWGNGRRN